MKADESEARLLEGDGQEEASRSMVCNRRVVSLCLSTFCLMLGTGMATPTVPALVRSLDRSASSVGLALSAFGGSRLAANIPIGWAADAYGRKPVLVFGGLLTGLGTFLSAFAPDTLSFVATRAIAGAGNACYLGSAFVYLAESSTPKNRARVLGANQAALQTAVTIGPTLGGYVAATYGLRSPFLVIGFFSFLSAVSTLFFADKDQKKEKPSSKRAEESVFLVVMSIIKDLRFLSVGACHFCAFALRQGGRNLLMALVATTTFGYDPKSLGALYGLMALIDLALLAPASTLSDLLADDRRFVAVPALILNGVAVALVGCVAQTKNHNVFLGALVLWAVSAGFLGPTLPAFAADVALPAHRALFISLFRSCGDLGFLFAPYLVGILLDTYGPRVAGFALTAFVTLVALFFAKYGLTTPQLPQGPDDVSHRP